MARKRMIDPGFFVSRPMNDLPIEAMVTFAGIWCWADDYGRGEDDEALVKAAVWPRRKSVTEAKVRAHIDALADKGVICQYHVNGFDLIHCTSWSEHQKISHPTKSKLPPCPKHDAQAFHDFLNDPSPTTERFRDASRGIPEDFRSDSGDVPERLHDSVVKSSSDQVSEVQKSSSSVAYLPSPARAGGDR